ncbi:hypothetical protein HN446_01520 [bacterium]|jgi:hypothetical protein|nr:hypothetical protein [bacterium]
MRSIFLSFILFFSFFSYPEGFVSGTLVLTSNGYTKIESLVPGDKVLCSDLKTTITVGVVKEISHNRANQAVEIQIKDETIKAASAQRFYDATEFCWKKAQNIKAGAILLGLDKDYEVELALASNGLQEYFSITVEPYSNFFVSKQNILVHNAAVLLRTLSDQRVGEAVAVAGAAVGEYFFGKENNNDNEINDNGCIEDDSSNSGFGNGPIKPPEDDLNKKNTNKINKCDMGKILKKEKEDGHIFGQDKHRFKEFGIEKGSSRSESILKDIAKKVVKKSEQGNLDTLKNGVYKVKVDNVVSGKPVEVRGRVVNGELNIGTAYIPKEVK